MNKLNGFENVKIDMVNAEQMTEEERNSIFNREASVDAIPDLDVLTSNVYSILSYLEKPETQKLLKTNETAVKMYLNNKYAESVPLGIITLLMEQENKIENIEMMLNLFNRLRMVKKGSVSLEDADKEWTDNINNRYLYSKYGSKEGFEKALAEEVKKEKASNLKNIGKSSIKK